MKFWAVYWTIWLAMILVADPIADFLGKRNHVGDKYTFTHYAAVHLGPSVIIGILAYLMWHFLVVHRNG